MKSTSYVRKPQVHYWREGLGKDEAACSRLHYVKLELTRDIEQVTCKTCMNTVRYKNAVRALEVEA